MKSYPWLALGTMRIDYHDVNICFHKGGLVHRMHCEEVENTACGHEIAVYGGGEAETFTYVTDRFVTCVQCLAGLDKINDRRLRRDAIPF